MSTNQTWSQILSLVLGDKQSTKEAKAIQRAVRIAREQKFFAEKSKTKLRADLKACLEGGTVHGFAVEDGRLCKKKRPAEMKDDQTRRKRAKQTDEEGTTLPWRESVKRIDVKSGPYSKEEKETLRSALLEFAEARGFPADDFSWLVATGRGQRSKDTVGVWKAVAAKLPQRTVQSVAAAGSRMFHPYANKGKWTAEEDEQLRSLVQQHGRKWVFIGGKIQRTGEACRDRWKEIQLGDSRASGYWTEDEVERLKKAIEEYSKAAGTKEGRTIGRRVILDDLDWNAISARVQTRSPLQCLDKWYCQVSPSMVARGDWGPGEDKIMLRSLWDQRHRTEFQIDWNLLVKGRTAAQTKRRWRLMTKVVPNVRNKNLTEIVEYLVEKFLPG